MCGIYKVTNIINNKVYIGLSRNIEERWKRHRSRPFNSNYSEYNSLFYRAIRKYGLNNFIFEVLEECPENILSEKEKYWINYYKSNDYNYGYNMTEGGENPPNFSKLTKEDVDKIQELLINSDLKEIEIAQKFNVHQTTITKINQGLNWINSQLTYPLRDPFYLQRLNMKIYKCKNCGKEISNQSTLCRNCYNLDRSFKSNIPEREILKKQIRIKTFVELGKIYGVSNTAIVKWCKKLNLPYKKSEIKKYSDEEWIKI